MQDKANVKWKSFMIYNQVKYQRHLRIINQEEQK